MTHALRRDAPVICASCGRQVQRQSRQQRFCSARCKEKGRTRVRRAFLGTDTGAPTNPPKNRHQFNGLQGKKTRSRLPILAPPPALAAGAGGRRAQAGAGEGRGDRWRGGPVRRALVCLRFALVWVPVWGGGARWGFLPRGGRAGSEAFAGEKTPLGL